MAHDGRLATLPPVEEVFACDLATAWIWAHGWLDKRKFKGQCLSRYERRAFDADYEKEDLIKGKVHHGWVLTVAGDLSGCGWDMTCFLLDAEPEIVDGRYIAETTVEYDDEDNETEVNPEVVDGPHKATWLVPLGAP